MINGNYCSVFAVSIPLSTPPPSPARLENRRRYPFIVGVLEQVVCLGFDAIASGFYHSRTAPRHIKETFKSESLNMIQSFRCAYNLGL